MSNNTKFEFIGNQLVLDFVNTQIMQAGEPLDLLNDFVDLITWFKQAGICSSKSANELILSYKNSLEAKSALSIAIAFRSQLRKAIVEIVKSKTVPSNLISFINQILRTRTDYFEVVKLRGKFIKRHSVPFDHPRYLIVTLADAAADFICSANYYLVKKCEDPGCIRFFYDTTKNHSRRWCSMDTCGNRAKARAFYDRKKRHK
jgi:predicted RNA-binding Zn ribbon-like protein